MKLDELGLTKRQKLIAEIQRLHVNFLNGGIRNLAEYIVDNLISKGYLPPQEYKGYEALKGWDEER